MPFILRRTKDAVLSDLPPKTLQDVVVEPSPLQARLYQEFQEGQALAQITGLAAAGGLAGGEGGAPAHVFQSLLFLRKLCSHPLLVLDPGSQQHMQVGWGQRGCMCRAWLPATPTCGRTPPLPSHP